MRTLISSSESDSKRFTLESSSTSSSSRIVGCSSLICAKPLSVFLYASQRVICAGSIIRTRLAYHVCACSVSYKRRVLGGARASLGVLGLGDSVAHLTNFGENPF